LRPRKRTLRCNFTRFLHEKITFQTAEATSQHGQWPHISQILHGTERLGHVERQAMRVLQRAMRVLQRAMRVLQRAMRALQRAVAYA
jgi:hypothetical protein